MPIIIQKYGGTSVATADRIQSVARRLAARKKQGDRMVAVVSAMGDTTDRLLELAWQVADRPLPREMDLLLSTGETVSCALLAMALGTLGQEAVSLSGSQAGIRTDALHRRARIQAIDPTRIHRELDEGKIVIVAGFQGITEEMDVTTLGRGGSDTTAVALAAGLGAAVCEIYTDVTGVYTADPRLVAGARKLRDIDYEEMAELASSGAQVLHTRAVELGWVYDVPILVASSFTEDPGTLIHGGEPMEVRNKVRGIAHDFNVAKVSILGVPDRPGIAAGIFGPLAEAGISVDVIVQNSSVDKLTDLSFTVAQTDLQPALETIRPVAEQIGCRSVTSNDRLGKVSIVGGGIQNTPGYAARMFETLCQTDINIEMITTSEIRITCIVHESHVAEAIRVLHAAFQLEDPPRVE